MQFKSRLVFGILVACGVPGIDVFDGVAALQLCSVLFDGNI